MSKLTPETVVEALRASVAERTSDPTEQAELTSAVLREVGRRWDRGFKVCSACGRRLKPSAFGRNPSRRDGLAPHCLDCEQQRDRQRRAAPDKV